MKVCFNTYPWAMMQKGGGERQLHNYLGALQKGAAQWPELEWSLYDQWAPRLDHVDIIHFFGCIASTVDYLDQLKKISDAKLVLSPNFWPDPESWQNSGVFEQIKTILWLTDIVVVNSFIEKEGLVRLMKIDPSRIAIVYNAADPIFELPAEQDLFRSKFNIQGRYVLNVANVEPRKNQLAFLRALKSFPELTLVTIGSCRDKAYFEVCQREAGNQFVWIPELEPNSQILRSAIAGCEFFAMPSIVETPSIASLEAALAGAKVLTTELGSPREYFDDMAVYVNPYDVSQMASAIASVQEVPVSPALSEKIRNEFTWDAVVHSLVDVYRNI